jgi:predicted enzyme related to lactoylglutathione lyase
MSNADIRGRFVWHELMTTDTKAAAAFYPKLTAWKTQAWDKDPSYTLWVSAKGPFGGVRTLPDAGRAAGARWLAYIGTPDVDASVQAAQRLGARVTMGAPDIPSAGRMSVLADPQGAEFALYGAPAGSQGDSGSSSAPEAFSWHELATTDAVAALGFYSELFGWTEVHKHDMGAMGIYHLVGTKGAASIGMFKVSADRPTPTRWLCYAHVPDVDKSANAAKAGGGKLVHGPMEVPGGSWIAQLIDPQGAAFAVHADKRVAAATPAPQPAKAAAPKPAAAAPAAKPSPPTLSASASAPAAAAAPAKPKSAPTLTPTASAPATSSKPAAAQAPPPAKPAAPTASAKTPAKTVAKKAVKKAAKKAAKKKSPARKAAKKKVRAKKRPQRKSKSAAKRATRKSSAKRKSVKKRAKKSSRGRSKAAGFAAAKRFAVKQADSLLKRLRGKKHR